MKKIVAIATFIVAGAGALTVGATLLPQFNGSDTLGRVTPEMIGPLSSLLPPAPPFAQPLCQASFPAALSPNLQYLGGGSTTGENNMIPGLQQVTPMSRFMQGGAPAVLSDGGIVAPGKVCLPKAYAWDAAAPTSFPATGGSYLLDAGGPTITPGSPDTAQGLVIGLDGLSILANGAVNGGSGSCNGSGTATACSVATGADPTVGLAYDNANAGGGVNVTAAQRNAFASYGLPTNMPAFSFTSWHDVLEILYAGLVDPSIHAAGSDPEIGKNCASTIRLAIANNYGDLFETTGCASGGSCTKIQHLFRRDDASGTSDIFGSVLGLSPSASYNANLANTNIGTYFLGTDSYCNDLQNNILDSTGKVNGVAKPADWNAAFGNDWPGTNNALSIPNDDQDYDPIRRPCQGVGTFKKGEQVCERGTFDPINTVVTAGNPATYACGGTSGGVNGASCGVNPFTGNTSTCFTNQCWDVAGSLGLILPVLATNGIGQAADSTNANLFPQYNLIKSGTGTSTNCCNSALTVNKCTGNAQVTNSFFALNPTALKKSLNAICPNGDESQTAAGACWTPVDNNGDPNCWTDVGNQPQIAAGDGNQAIINTNLLFSSGGGLPVLNVDARVYNKYSYVNVGGVWMTANDDSSRPITGAYYRIHSTESLLATPGGSCGTNTAVCAQFDATDEIGCLVQASPCSLGYAGREATLAFGPGPTGGACVQGAASFKLRQGTPDAANCITTFQYPYSRKLYLNTITGFQDPALTTAELAFAQCENTGSLIDQALNFEGFVPLPSTGPFAVNGGNPYCEDFNEQMLCGASTNGNACAAAGSVGIAVTDGGVLTDAAAYTPVGSGLNVVSTTCGNGIVEAYEECDNGTAGYAVDGGFSTLPDGGLANGAPGSTCSTICRLTK